MRFKTVNTKIRCYGNDGKTPTMVDARLVSMGDYGYHPNEGYLSGRDKGKGYTITHLPTGLAVRYCVPTIKKARETVVRLQVVESFSDKPGRRVLRQIEIAIWG
jgi:hypothetical protein